MKVIVFGASGRLGREVVAAAAGAGHAVTAFVRERANVDGLSEGVSVVRGEVVSDPDAVSRAMPGHDAVLLATGTRTVGVNEHRSSAAKHVVAAMKAHGVRRVVGISAAGIESSSGGFFLRKVIRPLYLDKYVLTDMRRMEEVIAASGLDWVLVRAPSFVNGGARGDYVVSPNVPEGGYALTRADAAAFMVRQLTEDTYVRARPALTYKTG